MRDVTPSEKLAFSKGRSHGLVATVVRLPASPVVVDAHGAVPLHNGSVLES
jgi:hypothetical protein